LLAHSLVDPAGAAAALPMTEAAVVGSLPTAARQGELRPALEGQATPLEAVAERALALPAQALAASACTATAPTVELLEPTGTPRRQTRVAVVVVAAPEGAMVAPADPASSW